jgi:aconitate hydratase 2/2-methylisocitrate dehydratase
LTTVDVTGGIGLDFKLGKSSWWKWNAVRNENGDVVLEEAYSVATGTVLQSILKRNYIMGIKS